MKEYKLTQYSHGAGCGCKLSPQVLNDILGTSRQHALFEGLLVGNDTRDDAAVFDWGDGTAVISTTDFFMPIVDDAAVFGHIASVNAMSDIYAMGGTPMLAIAILGWPVDKLPAALAGEVIEGARRACAEAGIPLAGGHSIDCPEPIFGLAVTGRVGIPNIKKNSGAQPGDLLYLTKPLGIGILTTAQKRGVLSEADDQTVCTAMMQLNKAGEILGQLPAVHAMTDVTGFGLAGHLLEICEASGTSAEIHYQDVPRFDGLEDYITQGCIPGGTHRNFASYGSRIGPMTGEQKFVLCDPQTSGGLLVAVSEDGAKEVSAMLQAAGTECYNIGSIQNLSMRRQSQLFIH